MEKKNIFMFSGQGSQYYQMGKGLYNTNDIFRKKLHEFDEIVKDLIGSSLCEIIYDENKRMHDEFSRTLYTHPAIFIVESALVFTLASYGITPDLVMGTSLGEFTAAAVAGILSYEKALDLIIKQAECIEQTCEEGYIVVVFGNPSLYEDVEIIKKMSNIATINSENHFAIAGIRKNFKEIFDYFKAKDIMYQILPVSHGFHSRGIDPASESFQHFIAAEKFKKPDIPFISSLYGKEVNEIGNEYFWEIAREPILFVKALESINAEDMSFNYIDLGPTGTLATLTKYYNKETGQDSEIFQIMNQFGKEVENLEIVKSKVPAKGTKSPPAKKDLVAYVFPGQGSQKKGMGEDLFDEYKEHIHTADAILGYSVKELCLQDPENNLKNTQYTQPALFIVNALEYLKRIDSGESKPDFVAGHSLGEYSALFAAGAFNFETGVKLTKKRGELMSKAQGGGMAAVIGMTEKQIEEVINNDELQNISIANINSPSQIVISGMKDDILHAQSFFEEAGCIRYIPLNVSGAFHSRFMKDAGEEFDKFLKQFQFSELTIPVIANVSAQPYTNDTIRKYLTDQITHSVRWTDSIMYLIGKGVKEFIEVGPGNVLKRLIAAIKKDG